MKLGVTEYIDCAHFLSCHAKRGNLHGHTYKVEITVEGELRNGMVVDFADLKQSAREVFAQYDHRNWNDFLEYPSVENICQLLSSNLKQKLPFSFTLRVWEGHGKWAEI